VSQFLGPVREEVGYDGALATSGLALAGWDERTERGILEVGSEAALAVMTGGSGSVGWPTVHSRDPHLKPGVALLSVISIFLGVTLYELFSGLIPL
jgi:hypothetical protein